MKLIYSLFHRELLRLPAKRYFYCKRICILIIIKAAFLFVFINSHQGSAVGLSMYSDMVYFLLISLMILAPVFSLDLIIPEKESRTLELLLLTDLSPLEIIVAKYFSRIFYILLLYLSALPVILLCITSGGISGQQILASTCIIFGFMLFGAAIGLLDSVLSTSKTAGIFSIAVMIIYLAISLWISSFISITSPIFIISPFGSMKAVLSGQNLLLGYYNGICQSVLAICCVLLTSKIFYRIYLDQIYGTQVSFYHKCVQWITEPILIQNITRETPESIGNVMDWYDTYTIHTNEIKKIYQIIILIFIMFFSLFIVLTNRFIDNWIVCWLIITTGIALVTIWTLLFACWRSFIHGKRHNTWEFILVTDLSPKEIMRGKMSAIYRVITPHCIFLVLSSLCSGSLFLLFPAAAMPVIALRNIAIYSSLKSKTIWQAAIRTFLQGLLYILFIPGLSIMLYGGLGIVILLTYFPVLIYVYDYCTLKNLHLALGWE